MMMSVRTSCNNISMGIVCEISDGNRVWDLAAHAKNGGRVESIGCV